MPPYKFVLPSLILVFQRFLQLNTMVFTSQSYLHHWIIFWTSYYVSKKRHGASFGRGRKGFKLWVVPLFGTSCHGLFPRLFQNMLVCGSSVNMRGQKPRIRLSPLCWNASSLLMSASVSCKYSSPYRIFDPATALKARSSHFGLALLLQLV